MVSSHNDQIINDAVYSVVWGDYVPKYDFIAEYSSGTMMDPEYDPFHLFGLELMAISARKKYGLNNSSQQD
tara:strand:- start:719 stop:931 length:213 start_codon:yes stop_codon:yes gene_type:complete